MRIKQENQDDLSKEEYFKNEQKTALFLSFEKENLEIINLLLSYQGINVNIKSSEAFNCKYENQLFNVEEAEELGILGGFFIE